MRRPDRLDWGVVAAAVVVAGAAVVGLGYGSAEWVFFSALSAAFGLVVRALFDAWGSQRRERRRADLARSTDPGDAAVEAVRRERGRMADDIAVSLREHLAAVQVLATDGHDRRANARLIHARSKQASSELRRHLGLLRESEDPPAAFTLAVSEGANAGDRAGPRFVDLILGAVVTLVALVEAVAARAQEDMDRGWLTVALTGLAGFAVTWWRAAPARASLGVVGVFIAGAALGEGVIPGLWLLAGAGGLLWGSLARRGRGLADVGAGLTLVAVAGTSTTLTDPVNAPMTWGILAALAIVAGVTGVAKQFADRAAHEAGEHEAVIEHASGVAVQAERTAFARELHDVVSHAVGLIAMQAAAAEVSWEANRPAALRSLDTIGETAEATLADLDRLHPAGTYHSQRSPADLEALLARIEAAGTPVEAEGLNLVPAGQLAVVYRVIQESLTNVLRHAPGARARVVVVRDDEAIRLTVSDDGPGGPPSSDRGFGLVGLRERIEYAGGSLRVESGPAGGFVVDAVLPHIAPGAIAPDESGVTT